LVIKGLVVVIVVVKTQKTPKARKGVKGTPKKKQDEELSEVTWLVTYLFRVPTKQLLASLLFFSLKASMVGDYHTYHNTM
jgi:hypothetical protein